MFNYTRLTLRGIRRDFTSSANFMSRAIALLPLIVLPATLLVDVFVWLPAFILLELLSKGDKDKPPT